MAILKAGLVLTQEMVNMIITGVSVLIRIIASVLSKSPK